MPVMRFTGKVSYIEKRGSIFARATFVNKEGKRKEVWRKVDGKKSDAKEKVIKEIEDQLSGKEDPKTFLDLAEYYKSTRAIPAEFKHDQKVKGTKTHKQLKSVVNAIASFYGHTPLERMTRDAVSRYRVHILNLPVKHIRDKKPHYEQRSLASVNQHIKILRAMLNVAEQERWIEKVPSFKGLISLAAEERREEIPSRDEFKRILAATQKRQRLNHIKPVALMVADCGARPVELWWLKWESVDFEKMEVTLMSDKGARRLYRTIPITSRVAEELQKLPRLNEYVFGGIKAVKRGWTSIKTLANTDVDLYSLRHVYATRLDMMPISQVARQKLMGHATKDTIGRYIKITQETKDLVRALLEKDPYLPAEKTTSAPS